MECREEFGMARQKNPAMMVALITAGGLVLAATVTGVFAVISKTNSDHPNGPTTSATSPTSCDHSGLTATADAQRDNGGNGLGVSVPPVYYSVNGTNQLYVSLNGQVKGGLPSGQAVDLVSWPDPTPRDSTPDHKPGSGVYYPIGELNVGPQGCWSIGLKTGYDNARGITFRYYLSLPTPQQVVQLEERRISPKYTAYTHTEWMALGVRELAHFNIRTG
jgi:hypothetical protein